MEDADGTWTAGLAAQLETLSARVSASAAGLAVPDLRQRCEVLARGARLGARMLPELRERLVPGMARAPLPPASGKLISQSTETSLLYELGWLALEAGLDDEGLTVIHAVGTLLHGRLGGAMFKVEAFLATGRSTAATRMLEECLADDADPDGLAAATLASLWAQRGVRSLSATVESLGDVGHSP